MTKIKIKSKHFKKMSDPENSNDRYISYVHVEELIKYKDIFMNWLDLNPRSQNLDTNVSKKIKKSLISNKNFHLLNRGILFSVRDVNFNNQMNEIEFTFTDQTLHGNIDGGHTLRIILELTSSELRELGAYVSIEFIKGVSNKEEAIDLAEARNTSAAVDLRSIENLKGSFEVIKNILDSHDKFKNRIRYKMFEKPTDSNTTMIDIRELIAILNVFNSNIYKPNDSTDHPIQSYSGKEVSLRKFVYKYGKDIELRNNELLKRQKIWDQIFDLWDQIELDLNSLFTKNKKQFAAKYSFVDLKDAQLDKKYYTKWNQKEIISKVGGIKKTYKIPSGIIYPIISAFRVLLDEGSKFYDWNIDPLVVWNDIGENMALVVHNNLENSSRNPDKFAKNKAVWDSLYDKVKTYKQQKTIDQLTVKLQEKNN